MTHFTTNAYCRVHQFGTLLSYTPQLRYFSCAYLSIYKSRIPKMSMTSLNLTHLYVDRCLLSFDQFESFVAKYCLRLKLLRLSTRKDDETYLDGDRWQRLISSHMPDLKVFDFEHFIWINTQEALDVYHMRIAQFDSSFWHQRKWFFEHEHDATFAARVTKFYSTRPYRYDRSQIEFQIFPMCFRRFGHEVKSKCGQGHVSRRENEFNLAKRIMIDGDCINPHYSIQYPRVTELSLSACYTQDKSWLRSYLNCNIPLAQITFLHISYRHLVTRNSISICSTRSTNQRSSKQEQNNEIGPCPWESLHTRRDSMSHQLLSSIGISRSRSWRRHAPMDSSKSTNEQNSSAYVLVLLLECQTCDDETIEDDHRSNDEYPQWLSNGIYWRFFVFVVVEIISSFSWPFNIFKRIKIFFLSISLVPDHFLHLWPLTTFDWKWEKRSNQQSLSDLRMKQCSYLLFTMIFPNKIGNYNYLLVRFSFDQTSTKMSNIFHSIKFKFILQFDFLLIPTSMTKVKQIIHLLLMFFWWKSLWNFSFRCFRQSVT